MISLKNAQLWGTSYWKIFWNNYLYLFINFRIMWELTLLSFIDFLWFYNVVFFAHIYFKANKSIKDFVFKLFIFPQHVILTFTSSSENDVKRQKHVSKKNEPLKNKFSGGPIHIKVLNFSLTGATKNVLTDRSKLG